MDNLPDITAELDDERLVETVFGANLKDKFLVGAARGEGQNVGNIPRRQKCSSVKFKTSTPTSKATA